MKTLQGVFTLQAWVCRVCDNGAIIADPERLIPLLQEHEPFCNQCGGEMFADTKRVIEEIPSSDN